METGGYLRIKQYKYLIPTLPKLCMVTVVGAQQTSEHVDPHNHLYQLELLLSPSPRRRPSYVQHYLFATEFIHLRESKAKCRGWRYIFSAPQHEGLVPRLTLILGGGEICVRG